MNHYFYVLKNFSDFSSRARRKEYWMFALFYVIVLILIGVLAFGMSTVSESLFMVFIGVYALYVLAMLIPSLAVTVRRLHDIDKSGWFILISLIPFIGGLILLVMTILPGTVGHNSFGPDPKG